MTRTSKRFGVLLLIFLLGLSMTIASVNAQDEPPTLPVSVLTLQFSAQGEIPDVELAQDVAVLTVGAVGTVTGDLEGTFSQRITEVDPYVTEPITPVNRLVRLATYFTIETDEGRIEGYYSGPYYFPEETYPDGVVHQHGRVIFVTPAYADLFWAEVYYDGIVDFEEIDGAVIPLGDSGTIIIAPD